MSTSVNRSEHLYDQVYEELWSRILSGEIKPGARLSDVQWSAELKVSRTPVREAMRKLQQDGVLLPLTRGGYEVLRVSADDLQRLYRCRAALESLAVRECAEKITKRQLQQLTTLFNQTEQAVTEGNLEQAFKLNTQFHRSIVKYCGNPYLQTLLNNLSRMILYARSSLMIAAYSPAIAKPYREHLESTQKDHGEILELLKAGDADGAARRMERHLFATSQNMSQIAKEVGNA